MRHETNRGGPKPRMLGASSRQIPIAVNGQSKLGIYEESTGTLARRVELPEWLSEAVAAGRPAKALNVIQAAAASLPKHDIAESKGHIFLRPPAETFAGPAVGIDLPIFKMLANDAKIKRIQFSVYATGHKRCATWTIGREEFMAEAKEIRTSQAFDPQMMVPLSILSERIGM